MSEAIINSELIVGRRIVVTGAGGFVGSAVVRRFVHERAHVVALVRPGGDRSRLDGVACVIDECDLEDDQAVIDTVVRHSPDIVVNSACSSGHPTDEESIQRAWNVNTMGTVRLLRAMSHVPAARLVHIGSSLEYAPSTRPLSETSPCEPTTVRGASKLAATVAVRQWCTEQRRDGIILRLFAVYGPRQQTDRLIPTLIRCAHTGATFPMLEGTSRRDLVWVDDVATACVLAVSAVSAECPIINIASGIEHSVAEVLAAVEHVTSSRISTEESGRGRKTHDVEHWVADMARCEQVLGWRPPTTLIQGLTEMAGRA